MKPLLFKPLLISISLTVSVLSTGCSLFTAEQKSPNPFSHELYNGKPMLSLTANIPPESEQQAQLRGDNAYREGNLDLAIYQYLRATSFPDGENKAQLFYKIGYLHTQKGNTSLALQSYQYALQQQPEHSPSLSATAVLLTKNSHLDKAKRYLDKVIGMDQDRLMGPHQQITSPGLRLDGRSPLKAYLAQAIIWDLKGQNNQAQQLYHKVITINNKIPASYINLGYSYYLDGQLEKAEQATKKALDLSPQNQKSWGNLGLIYIRMGHFDAAANAFMNYLDPAEAYNNLGYFALLDGSLEEAVFYSQKAIDLNPAYYEKAHSNLLRAKRESLAQSSVALTRQIIPSYQRQLEADLFKPMRE